MRLNYLCMQVFMCPYCEACTYAIDGYGIFSERTKCGCMQHTRRVVYICLQLSSSLSTSQNIGIFVTVRIDVDHGKTGRDKETDRQREREDDLKYY